MNTRPAAVGPERFRLGRPGGDPQHFAAPVRVHAHGDYHGNRDDAAALTEFQIRLIDPQIRPLALDRAGQEAVHPLVDLADEPADLAFGDATGAHGADEIIDRPGGNPLHIGFLDDRQQRLFRRPPGLEEGREIASLAQLRDRQFDCACPRVPVSGTVTVALGQAGGRTRAQRRPSPGLDLHLHLHHPIGSERQHLTNKIAIRRLLHKLKQRHLLIGHRLVLQVQFAPEPYQRPAVAASAANLAPTPPHGTRPK